jgi:ubiquinone/menaquinone biosynthesis C-methylase UbiE
VKSLELSTAPSEEKFSAETHWEKAAKTLMGKYITDLESRFIFDSIDLSKQNMTIMDVGAEAGRFSLIAANNNATVVSIDIDSYSLKRLKQKNRQVNIIQADARKIPLKDHVLDAVFMIEVLDYIPELELALAESNRTLKPEGSCILSFGNKSSIKARIKKLKGKSYRHSYTNVLRVLSKNGFVLKNSVGYSWLPFGRVSENKFIPLLASVERLFGLRRVRKFSPWVIMHIAKLREQ